MTLVQTLSRVYDWHPRLGLSILPCQMVVSTIKPVNNLIAHFFLPPLALAASTAACSARAASSAAMAVWDFWRARR